MVSNYSEVNLETILSFLRSKGLNEFAVFGIVANLYKESYFRADNLQNSYETKLNMTDSEYVVRVDSGAYSNFSTDGAGFGLCQWTSSGRKTALYDFVKTHGKSIADINIQLEFFWHELTTSYKSVLKVLQNTKSIDEAARVVMLKFERPKNQTEENQLTRVGYGLEFYEKYGKEVIDKVLNTVDKVLKIAEAEVGYLEKKSNKHLDDKTANAGSANYTKYGRDMHNIYPSVMDFPAAWCDAFVDWCFYQAYGVCNAKGLLGGNFNDYTPSSANLYKNKKAWYTSPEVGDQIFFKNSQRINHTGLVYKVDDKKVYTIEGNTSGASGVVANGGGVCKKSYPLNHSKIAGYGRPKYDKADTSTETKEVAAAEEVYDMPTIRKGSKGKAVKIWQVIVGVEPDGDYGNKTLEATKEFQKANGLTVDGIVGKNSWRVGLESV